MPPTEYRVKPSALREKRRSLFLSRAQLAEKVGVTRQRIGQMETTEFTGVSAETAHALARALDVDLARIIERVDEVPA